MESALGADEDEVPLARREGDGEVETPGGSAVILVPENMVSMVTGAAGLLQDPIWLTRGRDKLASDVAYVKRAETSRVVVQGSGGGDRSILSSHGAGKDRLTALMILPGALAEHRAQWREGHFIRSQFILHIEPSSVVWQSFSHCLFTRRDATAVDDPVSLLVKSVCL